MDSEEKEQIEEWREKAKKELHDWYERRDEQLGKTQTSNRYVFFFCHGFLLGTVGISFIFFVITSYGCIIHVCVKFWDFT